MSTMVTGISFITLIILLTLNSTWAHTITGPDSASAKKATPALRERTYKTLTEIQQLIEDRNITQAKTKLTELLNRKLNAYEEAQALNLQAYIFHSTEQFQQAIKTYNQILDLNGLPSAFRQTLLYSVSQLYISVDDYPQALHMLQHWFDQTKKPTASAYALRAQLQYQQQQTKQAQSSIEHAINMHSTEGKTPKEAWWQLLLAIHYDQKQFPQMILVLENLITWYSKARYWTQLASLYGQQNQPDKQLQTLDAAYINGYLTDQNHLLQLAQLMQEQGGPYQAGKILEKGIDEGIIKKNRQNWQQLASAWYAAKELEKAVIAMEQAATLANNAHPFLQLAYLLLDLDRHAESLAFANKALAKTTNQDTAIKIHTLIGTVHYDQKRFDSADQAFSQALQLATLQEQDLKPLQSWKKHIQQEKRRYELVKEYL